VTPDGTEFSGGYDRVRSGGTSQEMAGEDPGVI
jgi:hypothetical protein